MSTPAVIDPGFVPSSIAHQPAQELKGETRVFVGDGGPILAVPGLKSVEQVRINGAIMDLSIVQKIPTTPAQTDFYTHRTPVFMIDGDGASAVLRRVVQSNDGLWQKGAQVAITGEWETTATRKQTA